MTVSSDFLVNKSTRMLMCVIHTHTAGHMCAIASKLWFWWEFGMLDVVFLICVLVHDLHYQAVHTDNIMMQA